MKQWVETYFREVFVALLMLVFSCLGFFTYLQLQPSGLHFTRQTDTLAFVDYYQRNGFSFFNPGGWYLGKFNGETAGEFPLLYYITAVLTSFLGEKQVILRVFSLLIVSIGFYHLFRLIQLILNDTISAFVLAFLFLSSTIVLYYSVNYLADSSAFGLTLSAYYFGIKSRLNKDDRLFVKSLFWFVLSGLLKVTFLIHPFALLAAIISADGVEMGSYLRSLKFNFKKGLFFIIMLFVVASWYLFAHYYNDQFDSNIFLTSIVPIWTYPAEIGFRAWRAIYHDWFSSYYYQTAFHLMVALMVLALFVKPYKMKFQGFLVIFLLGGVSVYVVFFMKQFTNHDYYMLNVAPLLILTVLFSYSKLSIRLPFLFKHPALKGGLAVIVLLSFNYANGKLVERYLKQPVSIYETHVNDLKGIDVFLDNNGISRNDKFLVFDEKTNNGAFYFINRPGWNIEDVALVDQVDLAQMLHSSQYAIIYDEKLSKLIKNSGFQMFLTYKNTFIWKKVN